jgi:hypothetical protein
VEKHLYGTVFTKAKHILFYMFFSHMITAVYTNATVKMLFIGHYITSLVIRIPRILLNMYTNYFQIPKQLVVLIYPGE